MIEGKSEEETIAITMEVLGVSRERAIEILAIEQGEISGDVVAEDAPENP